MYKVLIADDEANIREGLQNFIPWSSIGMAVAALMENGRQVLDYLEEREADVLLLDVQMPVVSGLEVMETVSVRYPDMRCVILSGHADFHYAQQAMAFGVTQYLLKPVDLDQMEDILRKIANELDERKRTGRLLADMQLIRYLRTGAEPILPKPQELGIGGKYMWIAVAEQRWRHRNRQTEEAATESGDWSGDGFGLRRLNLDEYHTAFCIWSGDNPETQGELHERLSAWMRVCLPGHFVAVSSLCRTLAETREGYLQAMNLLKLSFWLGGDSVLRAEDAAGLAEANAAGAAGQTPDWDKLGSSIRTRDEQALHEFFARLFAHSGSTGSPERAYELYNRALQEAERAMKEFGQTLAPDGGGEGSGDLYARIRQFDCHADLHAYASELCRQAMNRLGSGGISRKNRIVGQAKIWIDTRYYDTNLGLETVADKLQISKAYLSMIFKEVAGVNFNQSLKDRRMEEAIRLMQTNPLLKVYEISQAVGYTDTKYFCRVFKLHFGQYPEEYRKKMASVPTPYE